MLILMQLLACGDVLDQAACDTLSGDLHAVTASDKMDDQAAASFHLADHPHQITLASETGYVWTTVTSEIEASLHFDIPDVLQGIYLDGEGQAVPSPEENSSCADELAESYTMPFTEGTWYLELSGASEIYLSMAFPGATEDDDGHDHDHDH